MPQNAAMKPTDPRHSRLFLKEWRQAKGITQDELANRLGTSKSVISMIENGKVRWHQGHLTELAEAFGCEPHELLAPGPQPIEPIRLVWNDIPLDQRALALQVLEPFRRRA